MFAIEVSFSHTMVVNDYVLHGKGSADEGRAAMQFGIWNTEEVRELIEWVRAYNLDPAHTTKLEFLSPWAALGCSGSPLGASPNAARP